MDRTPAWPTSACAHPLHRLLICYWPVTGSNNFETNLGPGLAGVAGWSAAAAAAAEENFVVFHTEQYAVLEPAAADYDAVDAAGNFVLRWTEIVVHTLVDNFVEAAA